MNSRGIPPCAPARISPGFFSRNLTGDSFTDYTVFFFLEVPPGISKNNFFRKEVYVVISKSRKKPWRNLYFLFLYEILLEIPLQGFLEVFLEESPQDFQEAQNESLEKFKRNPWKILWKKILRIFHVVIYLETSLGELLKEILKESLQKFMKVFLVEFLDGFLVGSPEEFLI